MIQRVSQDWQDEYRQLTERSGSISLESWGQVGVSGNDRVKFLQNLCTNDVRRLEPGQMCEAFFTNVKGKILAHVLVIAEVNQFTLLTGPGQAGQLITHLSRYLIRENVQLADLSQYGHWEYVIGPRAAETATASGRLSVKCDLVWLGGFLIRGDGNSKAMNVLHTVTVDSPVFTALRVESFWPLYGIDFDESHLPQEVNLDARAISFTKGCYLGQETVARIDALGHVNKKLAVIKILGEIVPDTNTRLISDANEVGIITTSAWSPRFSAPMALAMVKRGFNQTGSRLKCDSQDAEVQ